MQQPTATTRLLSTQGKSVDAAPVLRRTASKGGKSPTRIKISLTATVTAACANAKEKVHHGLLENTECRFDRVHIRFFDNGRLGLRFYSGSLGKTERRWR
jgi:hypothetical protein